MMLVDNFKVIRLVVLICAAGLQSTEALKCWGSDAPCEEGKWCNLKNDGTGGCDATAGCKSTEEMHCCGTDDCNLNVYEICRESPKVKGCELWKNETKVRCEKPTEQDVKDCEEIKKKLEEVCKKHPEAKYCKEFKRMGLIKGVAAAGTYGSISILIVTLVSASLYYIPLNFFL